MKTLRMGMSLFLLSLCFVAFGQASKTDNKKNVYFVKTTHTPEQCLNTLTGMKDKGDEFLSKFEFGCMSGKHVGYAFLEGNSEDNVKIMLPKDLQAAATIQKVDKFTPQQIADLHKEHANK